MLIPGTNVPASPLDKVSYEDLYTRWERGNWRATELDFTSDREQWRQEFSELERTAALWNYSLFFWGEDAVTDGLSPYIDAAPREEHKYFLATQQADEARHAVFFRRFMSEVAGIEGGVGEALQAIRPQLTWGFRQVFDRLERMSDELRRDRSVPKLAQAITLYHLVIEATLAQPGQHFITSYLVERDLLPAFRAGMRNVAQDEQRHIGFGVKLLHDLRGMDADVPHAVADLLREVMPWAVGVLIPPGWDTRYVECFGFTLEQVYADGLGSLETKLRTAGLPLEELPGPAVIPVGGTPRARAEYALKLVRGGFLGEKTGPPSRDPETVRAFFEAVAGALDHEAAPDGPATIQWEFTDFEPWHVDVENGATRAVPGRAEAPTVTLRASFEDFVDLAAGRRDLRGLATRLRFRPRGNLIWLWRARRMFPR